MLLARRQLGSIRTDYRRDQDPTRAAQALSAWLKRVAMLAYPERGLAAASGDDWLNFLDASLGDDSFSRGCGRVFGGEIYRPKINADALLLLELCERWLAAVRPRLVGRERA